MKLRVNFSKVDAAAGDALTPTFQKIISTNLTIYHRNSKLRVTKPN